MKQRLVGTVVIGCLAVIFIPILLDGEGVSPPDMTASIPQAPPMPAVPVIEPVRPEIASDEVAAPEPAATVPEATRQPASASPAPPPAPEQPRLAATGIPETWAVRLGSFGEAANAESLVSRLRNGGYKGFARPLVTSRGTLTGVYVGPVLTEREAGRLQQELARAFELDGVVVQFSIDDLEE